MKIAILDKKDASLTVEQSCLKYANYSIPFKAVDLLFITKALNLNTKDILKLTQNNISLLLVNHNHQQKALIHSAKTKNSELKLAQYKALEHRLTLAKFFISEKFNSHYKSLLQQNISLDIEQFLQRLYQSESISEILILEAEFSRQYFQCFFSFLPKKFHHNKRSKRPPQDPVNALMSFWYSLIYHIITTKLLSYGFEPGIGYLHSAFRDHNALSSDIIELFRAKINEAIIEVFRQDLLSLKDFSKQGGVYLRFSGRQKTWTHFLQLVDELNADMNKNISYIRKYLNTL